MLIDEGKRRTKRTKWTVEQEAWLLAHKDIRGRGAMLEAFTAAFPGHPFTAAAISTKRTEIGAYGVHPKDRNRNAKPLYSERVKSGYVVIKVSKCEWWPKNRWVWVSTHPGEPWSVRDNFVFLDGNTCNFSPDNIMKVPVNVMRIISLNHWLKSGDPEGNRFRITRAMLRMAILDAGEKTGDTVRREKGRVLKSEAASKHLKKERLFRESNPEAYRERNHRYWLRIKERLATDPEFKKKYREKSRKYMKKYYMARKKNEVIE